MRIAIAGKGGTGKTTIAGTLARVLARREREVLAIDADTNPNLGNVLGIPAARVQEIVSLPRNLMERAANDRHVIVDMEAGLEHLSRGTGRHVSRLVAVLEPYYRSMETARNVAALAHELGIADVVVVANKVRDAGDRSAIADFCGAHEMRLVGEVPYDGGLVEAERRGGAPIDTARNSPAVMAIEKLAGSLSNDAPLAVMSS